ncbi:MAG: FIG00457213: hypothetical protein [uncultured Paraburkholderia sp.]|nr:MAG: FIG00457213: hypothetical protein [uncultured Paraburkholderia sp.]
MYVLYDYRYVIACSRLPYEFRRGFRRLARGRVTSTYDWRTRAKEAVPAETQCRRVAEVLLGFEALRAGGYALQTPWNFRAKHLQALLNRWSTQRLTSEEAAERLGHWCEFFRWIRKPQLTVLMNAPVTVAVSPVGSKRVQYSHASAYSRPDIPVIDHLAITPFGVFVVETKHWAGIVTRGETDDTLTLTVADGQRFVRASPIKQNAAKVRFLRNLLPPRLWIVEGLGVFSHEAVMVAPSLLAVLLERSELYRHLRVRQQQFARAGIGRLPVRTISNAILRYADVRPEALAEHRQRIQESRARGQGSAG